MFYGTQNIITQKALMCLLKTVQLVKCHSMTLKNEMISGSRDGVGFVLISISTDVRSSVCLHIRHDWDLCRKMAFILSTSNSQVCTFTHYLDSLCIT